MTDPYTPTTEEVPRRINLADYGHRPHWWVEAHHEGGSSVVASVDPDEPVGIEVMWTRADAEFIAAAHNQIPAVFAELDGLRAQIESVRELRDEWFRELENPDHLVRLESVIDATDAILAQSPRGTVARIQAAALESAAGDYKADHDFLTADEWLVERAAALREGTGQ